MGCRGRWCLFCLAFLGITSAGAADWFWRPKAEGPYGESDGRSYQNAWHSSRAITWEKMHPGDRLYVCGTHDSGTDDSVLRVGLSGTAAQPITISGDCPDDPGTLLGTGEKWVDGWSPSPVEGVLERQFAGSVGQIIDGTGYLTRQKGIPDPSWACRSFSQVARTVYYKPCGAARALYPGGISPVIQVSGRNHVHVDGLRVYNANRLIEVKDAVGFRLTHSTLRYGRTQSIVVLGSTSGGEIRGNQIHDVGNGPNFVSGRSKGTVSHDGWVVEDNHIHDVYGTLDSHCIGWQAGRGNVIRNNHLHDCEGSGITFYDPGFGDRVSDNLVEANTIHDIRDTGRGGRNQRGIEVNGENCPRHPNNSVRNMVRRNHIYDVEHYGLYIKAGRPTDPQLFSWTFADNVIERVENGVVWIDGHWYGEPRRGSDSPDPCHPKNFVPELSRPGFRLTGNVIADVTGSFVMPDRIGPALRAKDRSGLVAENNTYRGAGTFVWHADRLSCRGRWDAGAERCTVESLDAYRKLSGKEAASKQTTE